MARESKPTSSKLEYDDSIVERLRTDMQFARSYLQAAQQATDPDALRIAVMHIAKARGIPLDAEEPRPPSKLYLRTDGRVTAYHEAFADGRKVVEHWGILGTRGQTREHAVKKQQSAAQVIERVLGAAAKAGFSAISSDEHEMVLVEFKIDGHGTTSDLDKRHKLEDRLDEALAWTGLGHVDGGSIGSGTMEVACLVVDAELAIRVIRDDLSATPFADFSRIIQAGDE